MTRDLVVYSQPGLSNPKAVLLQNDVQADSITLTEETNTPQKYTGDLALNAGKYDISIQDDSGVVQIEPLVDIPAGDPVTLVLPVPVASAENLANVPQRNQGVDTYRTLRNAGGTIMQEVRETLHSTEQNP